MLCKKCGNELKMGSKFCYSCGYYIDEDEDYEDGEEGTKKKRKKKDRLTFKEKREKRKEEKQLAKEAKIRQKEIEAEEREREKLAAEYEKEQKIQEFYKKENENKIRAERRAKALEEKERERELERQKAIDDNFNAKKNKFDEELKKKANISEDDFDAKKSKFYEELNQKVKISHDEFNSKKSKFDEELKHKVKYSNQDDYDDENANFSYGSEDLITRSPELGFEASSALHHVKDEKDLSFDDFNVENRFKKIEKEAKKELPRNSALDISYDEYKKLEDASKKRKSNFSKYAFVILSSVVTFVVIFFLVYTITNKLSQNTEEPDIPAVVEDITVLLSNCTVKIPGNLNYNVEGSSLYVAYGTHTLSFTLSKDNYDNYSSDLTKLSNDFEKRKYTVSSSDKRVVNGNEFIIYKLIVNGSSKHFYLTGVNDKYVAMGMIEMSGSDSIETALQSVSDIILTIKM